MDIQFMEEYYKLKYADAAVETCDGDPEFFKIRHRAYQTIEKLEKRLEAISEDLAKEMNQMLDSYSEKYAYITVKAYLQGAADRERMLK